MKPAVLMPDRNLSNSHSALRVVGFDTPLSVDGQRKRNGADVGFTLSKCPISSTAIPDVVLAPPTMESRA